MTRSTSAQQALQVVGSVGPDQAAFAQILSSEALSFLSILVEEFSPRINELLAARVAVQRDFDRGLRPDFLAETAAIRSSDWRAKPLPSDLQDRRVEITGPVQAKMVINALNSGASVFMADLEDSTAPSWGNVIEGQHCLFQAVRRTLRYEAPETKKSYQLNDKTAVLMVRPRGLHLPERHILHNGAAVPGCLVDFGLYLFHNAKELLARNTGPYFYLPKLETHREARLWNDIFVKAQTMLGLPIGTIKATVLIETITASFEMDEIIYELKDHCAGLNCGRWDYIFSYIKKFKNDPAFVLPDRAQVTMTQPCMRAYTQLVIKTCHRRGVHAMGGMAAQIPIKDDAQANAAALTKVQEDKQREVRDGHDGTWVAHPGLVPIAREVFNTHMPTPNQIHRQREDVTVTAADLLAVPTGTITMDGVRHNIRVAVQYIESWLRGVGCVPLYNLMEDAATAEISRAQLWQWLKHQVVVESGRDGGILTLGRFNQVFEEELNQIKKSVGETRYAAGKFTQAAEMLKQLCTADSFVEFLTLPAYEAL